MALALANAVGNAKAAGKTYFLGGGAQCQSNWGDFSGIIFGALGIYNLPREWYRKDAYYTEYLDTAEAQQDLQYQQHVLSDYIGEMNAKFRLYRIVLWPFRLLVKRWLRGLATS